MALTFSFRPVTEKPGFDTSSLFVVEEKVVLVAVFHRVSLFSPLCIIIIIMIIIMIIIVVVVIGSTALGGPWPPLEVS
jgi:hypothetical protein